MRTRPRAFTTTELLVVLALLAVLFLLVIPAINTRRENRNRAVCANNLRAIGVALFAYAQDHNQHLPTLEQNRGPQGEPVDWTRALLPRYLAAPSLLHCPSDKMKRSCDGPPCSYGISGGGGGLEGVFWIHGARLDCPYLTNRSEIVLATEGWNGGTRGPSCVGDARGFCVFEPNELWPRIASFHSHVYLDIRQTYSRTTHYLFLDGRVEWIENPTVERLVRMFPPQPAGSSPSHQPCP